MLSKCANPECPTCFRYFREGRIFLLDVETRRQPCPERDGQESNGVWARKIEHFWLCGDCSLRLTLAFDPEHGVVLLPLRKAASPSTAVAARSAMAPVATSSDVQMRPFDELHEGGRTPQDERVKILPVILDSPRSNFRAARAS